MIRTVVKMRPVGRRRSIDFETAEEIRKDYMSGSSIVDLAEDFNTSTATVSHILNYTGSYATDLGD